MPGPFSFKPVNSKQEHSKLGMTNRRRSAPINEANGLVDVPLTTLFGLRSAAFWGALVLLGASPAIGHAQYQTLETQPPAEAAGQTEPSGPSYQWSVSVSGDATVLMGDVPYEAAAGLLEERAGQQATVTHSVNGGAPTGFLPDALAAIDAAKLLAKGEIALLDDQWSIKGVLRSGVSADQLYEVLGERTLGEHPWRIEVLEAPNADAPLDEIDHGQDGADESLVSDDAEADVLEVCQEGVSDLMAGRGVLFASGSANIVTESQSLLAELAGIFAVCPDASIYVEGHTDADGDAEANLLLSLSRAETVVDALIGLGVSPDRLYAVGYGESLPIASNETAAGKAQNRRIVFNFEDIAAQADGAAER